MTSSQPQGLSANLEVLHRPGSSADNNASDVSSAGSSTPLDKSTNVPITLLDDSGNPTSPTVIYGRTEPGERIFEKALCALTREDQQIIRSIIFHKTTDDLKGAQVAVLAKKQQCEEKRWTMLVKGFSLDLGAVAGALSSLLEQIELGVQLISGKASAIGSGLVVAATVAPLHISAPIAFVKSVLNIAVFSSDQMGSLLYGMSNATLMMKRLSLYLEFFRHVEWSSEASLLEDVLTISYSLIFTFLNDVLRVLDKQGPKLTFELLWSKHELDEFDDKCTAAAVELERAANLCYRNALLKQLHALVEQDKQLDYIKTTTQYLEIETVLYRLKCASGAAYDVTDKRKEGTIEDYCLPGTRQSLINELTSWCREPQETVFWVCGMAGTGKSTLVRTVARQVATEGLLAASFFFRQDLADQRDGSLFVQSIVSQLVTKYPRLRPAVAAALNADLTLPGGAIAKQFADLLEAPMSKSGLRNLVLVIDALDECEASAAKTILVQLAKLAKQLDLRIIVTSRPESGLPAVFERVKPHSVRLEEVEGGTEEDIRRLLHHRFAGFVEVEATKQFPRVGTGWPGCPKVEELVRLCKPLFIFAATICRYVTESRPKDRLSEVLDEKYSANLRGIECIYLPILEHVLQEAKDDTRDFKVIVGSIILFQNPLPASSLSNLLGLEAGDVWHLLGRLQSVLRVSDDPSAPIRILHKSFKDFLLDSHHQFRINYVQTHQLLLEACLRLMDKQLHRNLCNMAYGTKRADVLDIGFITPELGYACLHWVAHFKASTQNYDQVYHFLQRHFLHWLEALCWLDQLSSAVKHMEELRSCVESDDGHKLLALLDDAMRFVPPNRRIMDLAPLQLYSSAMIFTPKNSLVRMTYQHDIPEAFTLLPDVVPEWSAEILKLEGFRNEVLFMAFSTDNKLLACAGLAEVQVWDITSGEQRHKLDGNVDDVTAIAFHPHNEQLIVAYKDCTARVSEFVSGEETMKLSVSHFIKAIAWLADHRIMAVRTEGSTVWVWDLMRGQVMYKFEHESHIETVAISPDGTLLASAHYGSLRVWDTASGEERLNLGWCGFRDTMAITAGGETLALASQRTVQLWDVTSGRKRHEVDFSSSSTFRPFTISPNGKLLASWSDDEDLVRVWYTTGDGKKQKLEGHDSNVLDVAFSPGGKMLASVSTDKVIRLWNTATGKEWQTLEGHKDSVYTIAFSPDGKLLASGSGDNTVRLWDMTTGKERQTLEGHEDHVVAVTFSPNGKILASGSYDSNVRLWSTMTGKKLYTLPGHESRILTVSFSLDGMLLASGSDDTTIRLWDAMTGETRLTFIGHKRAICVVGFNQDGKLLASMDSDDIVRLWDIVTGQQLHHFEIYGQASFDRADRTMTRQTQLNAVEDRVVLPICRTRLDDWCLSRSTLDQLQTFTSGSAATDPMSTLELCGEWLRYEGDDILWLPPDHRGFRSTAYGTTLVIGQVSGAVSFFRYEAKNT